MTEARQPNEEDKNIKMERAPINNEVGKEDKENGVHANKIENLIANNRINQT